MLKIIFILVISLILTACGGSSSSSGNNDEPSKAEGVPSTVINNIKISTWMYQIQDLYDDRIDTLGNTNYDMLVVEPGFNFTESPYDTVRIVNSLSEKPNGDKRLLIAYVDIGQAEDYRDYWKNDWVAPTQDTQGVPDFLVSIDPDGWTDNYPVAYWDVRWKSIWLDNDGIIATLANQGFDGIYLDWVEAYDDQKVIEYAESQNIDPKREMLNFIDELRMKGKQSNPDFVVISQNAQYLLDYDPEVFASIIDGIATEDTWFYGEGDANWEDANAGDLFGGDRHQEEYSTENRVKQNIKYPCIYS